MNLKQIMKAAVNMAKRYEGAWPARMALALKAAWKQAKFFEHVTYEEKACYSRGVKLLCKEIRCSFKGKYFGSVFTDKLPPLYTAKFWHVFGDKASPKQSTLQEAVLDIVKAQQYRKLKEKISPRPMQVIADKILSGRKAAY